VLGCWFCCKCRAFSFCLPSSESCGVVVLLFHLSSLIAIWPWRPWSFPSVGGVTVAVDSGMLIGGWPAFLPLTSSPAASFARRSASS
jgi:hypothetical protein